MQYVHRWFSLVWPPNLLYMSSAVQTPTVQNQAVKRQKYLHVAWEIEMLKNHNFSGGNRNVIPTFFYTVIEMS